MRRALILPVLLVLLSVTGCEQLQAIGGTVQADPSGRSLRELADDRGFRIGATAEPSELADPTYAAVLSETFNAVTPENALKWYTVEPANGAWQFGGADAVISFAEANDMAVRGHTLVWAQDRFTPDWVRAIVDPAALRSEVEDYMTTVMTRYRDHIDRWDVVNEPLQSTGTGHSTSVFWSLGPDWIADAFRLAHSLDPTAELWLNEYGTDWVTGKHAALVDLVDELLAAGVPIDGVGLQMHRPTVGGPNRESLEQQLRDFTSRGLHVAITELDVPTSPADPDAFGKQAEAYRTIVGACLAVVGCAEVTTWGVSDASTWLDGLGIYTTPTRPLLFDDTYEPKPAYEAVRELLEPPLPLPGIDVEIYTSGDRTTPVTTVTTDDRGNFRAIVPPGSYVLHARTGVGHQGEWFEDASGADDARSLGVVKGAVTLVTLSLAPT